METVVVGDVAITRVEELDLILPLPPGEFFTGFSAPAWAVESDSLAPLHWDPKQNGLRFFLQPFIVRSDGQTILVDAGAGNDKDRPSSPLFDGLQTPFLDRLGLAGVQPDDVDTVIVTHLHVDHVGWCTRMIDGNWVPTFRNARYLFPSADWEFFHPKNTGQYARAGDAINDGIYEDSLLPVEEAGLAELFDAPYALDDRLTLIPAPGHTPGQAVLEVRSGSETALFIADVLHSVIQLHQPTWNMFCCEDQAAARATRSQLLARAADERTLVIPAHVGDRHAFWLKREGDRYSIDQWADFGSPVTEAPR